jgi:alpha-L-rhamnosidase
MDAARMNWAWDAPTQTQPEAQSPTWVPAQPIGHAAPSGAQDSPSRWVLQPDPLPPMRFAPTTPGHLVRITGLAPSTSLDHPITIPANSSATLLVDRDTLTTAFPSLTLTGGRNAAITLTYAEALVDANNQKGNRNEIANRHIVGLTDHILPDGQTHTFRTLWWRTWRFLQLDIQTAAQPLTLDHLDAFYTAYPFTKVASFESNDPQLAQIWDIGWRTAQLCAHETYMDTPYWEQFQYVGDTRIQALISYAVTGDDRLARQALSAFRNSLLTDGLTQSRYPSALTQVIPPFSLLWIGMLHDFWMYRGDPAFAASILPGTRNVLAWFSARQRPDGLLGHIEWWPFVDWSPPFFNSGVPPQQVDGGSSALTLQFIEALRNAADLEQSLGEPFLAVRYRAQADHAAAALMALNWDPTRQLLADTPEKNSFSQQANALAVWLDVIPPDRQRAVIEQILAPPDPAQPTPIAPASYYFRFYLARALVHAGLGDQYIPQLDPWRRMLALGLSTWAENPEPTRSDSHAWSAHPTFDLLTLVAGIAPASPGFQTLDLTPHLGTLQHASASMPTPQGLVQVRYTRQHTHWQADITLPSTLTGTLHWRDQPIPLHPGHQTLTLP